MQDYCLSKLFTTNKMDVHRINTQSFIVRKLYAERSDSTHRGEIIVRNSFTVCDDDCDGLDSGVCFIDTVIEWVCCCVVLSEAVRMSLNEEGYVVRIRGLPWSCTQEEVASFFSGENTPISLHSKLSYATLSKLQRSPKVVYSSYWIYFNSLNSNYIKNGQNHVLLYMWVYGMILYTLLLYNFSTYQSHQTLFCNIKDIFEQGISPFTFLRILH